MTQPAHDDKACTCHSYNADTGDKDEVGLLNQAGETVWIDACIAPVIKHLWDNNVHTEGSCCGHNGRFGTPSIVLAVGEENYSHIRELIASSLQFFILQSNGFPSAMARSCFEQLWERVSAGTSHPFGHLIMATLHGFLVGRTNTLPSVNIVIGYVYFSQCVAVAITNTLSPLSLTDSSLTLLDKGVDGGDGFSSMFSFAVRL